jgi:hypothetical protein
LIQVSVHVDIRPFYISWLVSRNGSNIHIQLTNWIVTNETIKLLSCCVVEPWSCNNSRKKHCFLVIWLVCATDTSQGSTGISS